MPPVTPTKPVTETVIDGVNAAVLGRLGLSPELQAAFLPPITKAKEGQGAGKVGTATGTDGSTGEGSTTEETETNRVAQLAEEQGITPEEVLANEAEAEQGRLQQLAEESGRSVEDIQAEEAESKRLEEKAAAEGKTVEEIQAEEAAAAGEGDHAEELETVRGELETATTRATELEAEVKRLKTKPVDITQQNLHPVLTADSESEIARLDADFASFEQWALKNWDGAAAVEGKGDQPGRPAYTAEEVRARYAEIKEQRAQLIPLAKQALATRREADQVAKAAYPKLYDPKNADAQFAQQLLKRAPGLKFIFPNVMMVIGDAIRGGQIRQAEEAKKKGGKAAAPARPAPRIAARPAPGKGQPVGALKTKPKPSGVMNVNKFLTGGGSRNALVATIMESGI